MSEIAIDVGTVTTNLSVTPSNVSIDVGNQYIPMRPMARIYDGPYEVTPTRDTQVLQTSGLLMDANLTVNPIPSNYGLITYSGNVLTVT